MASLSAEGPRPSVTPARLATPLQAAARALCAAHPQQSAVQLIPDGQDALALRVNGIRLAQSTLDIQTYIWRDDPSGRLISRELMEAADRGVRVRVLLDDMDARPRDVVLEALDAYENISVRMFNPFRTRSGLLRTLAELSQRGSRLNHRMHNKSWIIDNVLAITGGRNIGDEYFAAAGEINFIDMDVLLLGPAAAQTLIEFERYWHSELAVPIRHLRKYSHPKLLPHRLRARLSSGARTAEQSRLTAKLRPGEGVGALLGRPFVWSSRVEVVADDPRKALGDTSPRSSRVLDTVRAELLAATRKVQLISPYFIPGIGGTAALRSLASQGALVEILTNSLAATDVAIVHSGYAKYRAPLLEAGVRLYELKATPVFEEVYPRFRVGSSRASLHTKAAIVDSSRVFVGSFNVDPRSAALNCEMGVWIGSRQLAAELANGLRHGCDPRRSFTLRLTPTRQIEWVEETASGQQVHRREPYASFWRRWIAWVLEALPIESQL